MRAYGCSRRELFERIERSALHPLPESRFEYAEWKRVTLNVDYHVSFEEHYYSAPFSLAGEELWVRATVSVVEIFHQRKRVSTHPRSHVKYRHSTNPDHMPLAHRKHAEWTPGRILHWAQTVGPHTLQLAEAILKERRHPEQGYRSCLGLFRLAKKYGPERLDAACLRAFDARARSYRHVESILRNGLDQGPASDAGEPTNRVGINHENIRGADYYN